MWTEECARGRLTASCIHQIVTSSQSHRINLPILVFHRFLDYTRINHYTVSQTLLTTCTLRHAARAHGDGRTAGWPAAGILNLLSLQLLNSMNRRMAMPLMINHAFAICLSSQKRQ